MSALVKINDELQVEVVVDPQHEWLLSTKDVAEGYGLSESGMRSVKSRNEDEFEEGKHYIVMPSQKGTASTMWTKRGVARLGFFIKTPMAKEFRDWAEDYIIDGGPKVSTPAIPQTFAQALALAAEQALKLELQAPKVEVYDSLMDPQVTRTYTLTEVAYQLGYPQKVFFAMLRKDNIIYQKGTTPKSPYATNGCFHLSTGVNEDSAYTYNSSRVTASGLEFFFRKYGKKEV